MVADFTREEIRRLNKFDKVYLLVSGGRDSTYTALKLKEVEFWIKRPIILLFQDTGLNIAPCRKIIEALPRKTGWELETIPNTLKSKSMKLVVESMGAMEKAEKQLKEGKYSKKVFKCCYHLKKKPFNEWLKKEDRTNQVFINSIKLGDSWQRRRWLLDLIEEQEKFWFNRQKGTWYYYPLRDTVTKDVDSFLAKEKDFWNTPHSGCSVCPILVLFDLEKEGERYLRSVKVYNNLRRKVMIK